MRLTPKLLALAVLLATAFACGPHAPAPLAEIVVRVSSADSTRSARFATWATGGEVDVRAADGRLWGRRARLEISTPAEVILHEGVSSATFISIDNSPHLRFRADAPEGMLQATGRRILFERNADRTGVRVYPWVWPWQ